MRYFLPALLLLLSFGCGENPFPPQTLVERLRILGVRAEPPEVDPLATIELSALVADPQGQGRELQFTWAVCLIMLGSEAMDIDCPGPDSYPLEGQGPLSELHIPDLVAWLAEQGFPLDQIEQVPDEQIPAEMPLYVGLSVTAGNEQTRAVKRIQVRLSGEEELNQNPSLTGVSLDEEPVGEEVLQLSASTKYTLAPLADEATRQTYRRANEDQDRLEDFLFTWYSTAGEFSDRRTILDVDTHGNRLDENEWSLPDELGPATLWVVVRDGRFGTDWISRQFEIVP